MTRKFGGGEGEGCQNLFSEKPIPVIEFGARLICPRPGTHHLPYLPPHELLELRELDQLTCFVYCWY